MATAATDETENAAAVASSSEYLSMIGLRKSFGGVHALRGANLGIERKGSIHGLIGANGSGKSTLLKVLSGQLAQDEGSIELNGGAIQLRSPADAVRQGIAMVAQETALTMALSVTENVLLGGRLVRGRAGIDWRASHRVAASILDRLKLDIDPTSLVEDLRPDQRQLVEIARAISLDAEILILDEPTSSLSETRVVSLFEVMRELQRNGVTTLFVSHRMNELLTITDDLTILRDGRTVWAGSSRGLSARTIVDHMIGDMNSGDMPIRRRRQPPSSTPCLEVDDLRIDGVLHGVSLVAHEGEIMGVAGLDGCGRSELLEAIFGASRLDAGTIRLHGKDISATTARQSIAQGLGYVPPDRKNQGVHLDMSVGANLSMAATSGRFVLAGPDRRREQQFVDRMKREIGLKAESQWTLVGTLSGGNQQKVSLGKWLTGGTRLLLLDEPTRGVDVKARAEIHELLRSFAAAGMTMIVSSSENDELLEICDRILVLYRGTEIATISADHASEASLSLLSEGIIA